MACWGLPPEPGRWGVVGNPSSSSNLTAVSRRLSEAGFCGGGEPGSADRAAGSGVDQQGETENGSQGIDLVMLSLCAPYCFSMIRLLTHSPIELCILESIVRVCRRRRAFIGHESWRLPSNWPPWMSWTASTARRFRPISRSLLPADS